MCKVRVIHPFYEHILGLILTTQESCLPEDHRKITIWKKLFTDSVSVNKKYLTDTLSVNKKYLTDSVFPIEKKHVKGGGLLYGGLL